MEDFSTIVWVVFIVFSLVANYAGRKQKKAGQQHREEAWPGDRDNAETREEATEWPLGPILRPETTQRGRTATRQETARTTDEWRMDGRPGSSSQTDARTAGGRARQTAEERQHDMDRRRRDREYTGTQEAATKRSRAAATMPSTASSSTASASVSATAKQGAKNRQNSTKTTDRGQRRTIDSSLTTQVTDSTADGTTEARIAEEFDLRRAVVYAEILKPKFAEQEEE